MNSIVYMSTKQRRTISCSNVNYSPEGILHPDRVMDEYDLLYITDGSWDIIENGICHHVKKDQLLILEPGLRHYSQEKCTPHMRNMFIHCSLLPEDGLPSPDCLKLQKVTDCSANPKVAELFSQTVETYWSGRSHTSFRLSALLELLLAEVSLPDEADSPWMDSLAKDILHLFYTCPHRFFSPEALAETYGLSVRSLSTRFKKATGYTIHQYQIRLKLNMAHEQIPANPKRGIRDIALSFGFYDEFHFSRLYKRQFGYAPSVHRGMHGST